MTKKYPILKNLVPLFFLLLAFTAFSQTFTDNTPGTKTFTVPCGVTSITIEAWGGGGGGQRANGNPSAGGGGSGGGYVKATLAVTLGNNYSYFVGAGVSDEWGGKDGTSTWFINNTTLNAVGGKGAGAAVLTDNTWGNGAIAFITGNVGGVTVNSYGGNGANASSTYSGGGGSSGGSGSPSSNDAVGINGGAAPTDGYAGANGRANGNPGHNGGIGAGGSGGRATSGKDEFGGSGGNGQIRITYTSTFQTYCSPTFTSGVEPITNVTFAGIKNTTTNAIGGKSLESFCDIGTVVQGTNHQISIKGNTNGDFTNHFRIFIDWNQDGYFLDAEESYYIGTIRNSTGIDLKIVTGGISVPTNALLGNTRMRVMKRYNADPTNPCLTGSGFGQAEDYTINVTAPTDTYCTSYGNNTDGFNTGIRLVNFNTINNATPVEDNDYSDFTAISTTVTKEQSYNLTVNVNTDGNYTNYTYVWIDWNQDGDFSDPGEFFDMGTATNVQNGATLNSPLAITIPATASIGPTRMRVSTKYFSAPGSCDAGFDGEVEDYTINIVNRNIWNGSISTDWNNPGNWSKDVPGITNTLDVVIPSKLTNYPTINPGDGAEVINIEIEAGANLIVIDNYIKVTGDLTLNGKIDLNNGSQLVQGDGSGLVGTGTLEIDQQGTSDNFKYNYWGSPVNTTGTAYTIAGVLRDGTDPNAIPLTPMTFGATYTFADGAAPLVGEAIKLSTYWMYKYANLGNGYIGWTRVGKDGSINAGEGFTLKGSNTDLPKQNYTFVGMPNNGDINLAISANNDYLIGNPYPSAIDAHEFIKDNISGPSGRRTINIIDGNLYFWDHFGGGNHLLKSYEGGYGIVNLTGEIKAMATDALINNTLNESTKIPPKFIPVAQGFFVTAVSGIVGTENIQFKNSQRLYEKENPLVSQFMKNAKFSKSNKETEGEEVFPKIYLKFSSPKGFHRQILVGFIENTTEGFDIGYDAINNETFVEDMSWRTNNINFIIQAVPTLNELRKLPLEVKVATTGIIKISIDNAKNIPEDTEIFIKDNKTGEMHNISNKPFEIELTAGKYTDRFALTFKTHKLVAEDVIAEVLIPATSQPIIEGIHVFMNNTLGELQIKNNSTEEITSVALVNTLGQTIKTWNSNFNIRTISLPISTATGVYLVQITTKTGKTVKKISVNAP
jgi:hypothetical protein